MKAAVVHDFSRPPRYEDVRDPVVDGEERVVVEVLAAGLHPRVRSQAGGVHYTGTGELPLTRVSTPWSATRRGRSVTRSSTTRRSGRWPSAL